MDNKKYAQKGYRELTDKYLDRITCHDDTLWLLQRRNNANKCEIDKFIDKVSFLVNTGDMQDDEARKTAYFEYFGN